MRVGQITPIIDVFPVWESSITENDEFAVKIAKAAPILLDTAPPRDVSKIFAMLGQTLELKKLSTKQREITADALMRAVLRIRSRVPTSAIEVIRAHRNRLEKFPDIWRHIGSFA